MDEIGHYRGTNYRVMESGVDSKGNVVVGGFSKLDPDLHGICFVMKFDELGNKLWETQLATNCSAGVDDSEIDGQDRIVVSARIAPPPFDDPRPASLIQLSPSGTELWRRYENYAPGSDSSDLTAFSAVKVDSQNNILFGYVTLLDPAQSDSSPTHLIAAKYTSGGLRLWRKPLPIDRYIIAYGSELSKFMMVTLDGGIIFSGGSFGAAADRFLIKLNSNGRLGWPVPGNELPDLSSFAINRFNRLCAGGSEGIALFNTSNGRMNRLNTKLNYSLPLCATPDGGFLLIRGMNLVKISSEGRQLWSTSFELNPNILGIVPDGKGGWILLGGITNGWNHSSSLEFRSYSSTGELVGRQSIRGISFQAESPLGRNFPAVHRAPDGTLRVVVNETINFYPYTAITGIGIYSFAVDR